MVKCVISALQHQTYIWNN